MLDDELIRQQRRAVRNMPPVVTCDNCGLHYYQTSAPHVCAGWTTKEKVMSTTIEKPCGDCFNKSHTHQIVDYPVGARVEAVIDIPTSQGVVRAGTRGTVSSHCDDGRAYVSFDSGDAGHTFHQPEAYIRVDERKETVKPVTEAVKTIPLVGKNHSERECSEADCPCHEWVQRFNEHEPTARGGESGQSGLFPRYSFAVVTGRYKILDNRSDGPVRITQIATADGEGEARAIIQALNQHHSLLAERERLRTAAQAALDNLYERSLTRKHWSTYDQKVYEQLDAALNDQKRR